MTYLVPDEKKSREPVRAFKAFLLDEFWMLSWNGSVQHASVYTPKKDRTLKDSKFEKEKAEFKEKLIEFAEEQILPVYTDPVPEKAHFCHLLELASIGGELGKKVLNEGVYKLGVAQKLLNLRLKYLWCLGLIPEPPHCPVDRVVLGATRLREKLAWTRIRKISEYKDAIHAIRTEADLVGLSLAEWELKTFQAKR